MNATDELRHMLDDLGVDWDTFPCVEKGYRFTRWKDSNGRYVSALDSGETQYFVDFYWGPTPQQAIEATLCQGINQLKAENEKLRKLCVELWCCCPVSDDSCVYCKHGGSKGTVDCDFWDIMHDLWLQEKGGDTNAS